jgi:hypothetical protein
MSNENQFNIGRRKVHVSQTANFLLEKLYRKASEKFSFPYCKFIQCSLHPSPPPRQQYYVMSPKNQNNPLIGMHKLNGGYLHIAVYT